MRKPIIAFILVNLIVIGFLVRSVWTLLTLLVVDGLSDKIPSEELLNSGVFGQPPLLIPKIIHQTYINESIPDRWKEPQQSCVDLHKDYEYKFWTDKKSRDFVAAEYPWFLETFDSYPFPIQRADAIRYFVLVHFGGIYIDLDNGCNRRMDPLLAYPAWLRTTDPTGISNDVMGSMPRHPFFVDVINKLSEYKREWILPYVTVMGSTGPLFLSIMWRHYNSGNPEEKYRIRVISSDESIFSHHLGNSWHGNDVKLIFWMQRHWMLLTISGFAIAGIVFVGLWLAYRRFFLRNGSRGHGYKPLRMYLLRSFYKNV